MLQIGAYVVGILVLSVVGDFAPQSSSYFSRPDNFFNAYFVKLGWGWTLLVSGLFVFVTSYTYSCGNAVVVKNQMTRLVLATCVWYGATSSFLLVEERLGICAVGTKFLNKAQCLAGGFRWKGFDISGHCFLLVWNGLFLIEEGKAYLGWERIREMIRNEEHLRLNTDPGSEERAERATVLSKLSLDEFLHLRRRYLAHTPKVRVLFCLMAALALLWDGMLICTALFFHIMIEKVVAACAAVLLWFVLYRGIYVHPSWSPGLPGEGPFKYVNFKAKQQAYQRKQDSAAKNKAREGGGHTCNHHRHWSSKDDLPKFMGMPLYGLNNAPKTPPDGESSDTISPTVTPGPSTSSSASAYDLSSVPGIRSARRPRSRSGSATRLASTSKASLGRSW